MTGVGQASTGGTRQALRAWKILCDATPAPANTELWFKACRLGYSDSPRGTPDPGIGRVETGGLRLADNGLQAALRRFEPGDEV